MSTVDEIWSSMKSEYRSSPLSDLYNVKKKIEKKPVKHLDSSLSWMNDWTSSHTGYCVKTAEHFENVYPRTTLVPPELPEHPVYASLDDLSANEIIALIQHDINVMDSPHTRSDTRVDAASKLKEQLVEAHLDSSTIDSIADIFLKPLLRRISDTSDKLRETAAQTLTHLLTHCSDSQLLASLSYVFPALVTRLGSQDIDGTAHLPAVARPAPEQRPQEMSDPVEKCEEVRMVLLNLVTSLIDRMSGKPTLQASWLDETVGVLRALAMDPFHAVKTSACSLIEAFCGNHEQLLLHFSEPLARSVSSCLVHSHAKVRISGLRALTACLRCSSCKYTFDIISRLCAWQDPNLVPVKAFYEPLPQINYMSLLTFDRHPAVRMFWFETLTHWLVSLPDRFDFEQHIAPHLLTGLFDEDESIRCRVYQILHFKLGACIEVEKEAELRETRQSGIDLPWTYNGQAHYEMDLVTACAHQQSHREYEWYSLNCPTLSSPIPRPSLGLRYWSKSIARKFILALFDKTTDFRDCTAVNAARLLLVTVSLIEDSVTEWLARVCESACRALTLGSIELKKVYMHILQKVGRFVSPDAFWDVLKNFDGEAECLVLAALLTGAVESIPSTVDGLGRVDVIGESFKTTLLRRSGSASPGFIQLLRVCMHERFSATFHREVDMWRLIATSMTLDDAKTLLVSLGDPGVICTNVLESILSRAEATDSIACILKLIESTCDDAASVPEKVEVWLHQSRGSIGYKELPGIISLLIDLEMKTANSVKYSKLIATLMDDVSLPIKEPQCLIRILSILNRMQNVHDELVTAVKSLASDHTLESRRREYSVNREVEKSGVENSDKLTFQKQKKLREDAARTAEVIRVHAARLFVKWNIHADSIERLVSEYQNWPRCPNPLLLMLAAAAVSKAMTGKSRPLVLREEAPSLTGIAKPTRDACCVKWKQPLALLSSLLEMLMALNLSLPADLSLPHVPLKDCSLPLDECDTFESVLAQQDKSLRWNAAWYLTQSILDVAAVHYGELATLALRWEASKQQLRVLVCKDLLKRLN